MALSFMDNIDYRGRKPGFTRDMFTTVADMAAYNENYLPDVFITTCVEDGNVYVFHRTNDVDPVTGKWRLIGAGSLQEDIIADFTVGGIKEGDNLKAGTLIEEIIRKMLKGEKIAETALPSYYGVAATKITDLTALTKVNPTKNFSIKVSPNNQYVIIACPNDAGMPVITSFGFDYTSSFTTTVIDDYTFFYSETKITNPDFEYTITYN